MQGFKLKVISEVACLYLLLCVCVGAKYVSESINDVFSLLSIPQVT